MKTLLRSLLLLLSFSGVGIPTASAAGWLHFDSSTKSVTLSAHLIFYSVDGVVRPEEAELVKRQIEALWSGLPVLPEDNVVIPLHIRGHRLVTALTYEIVPSAKTARARAEVDLEHGNIYVRIDNRVDSGAPATSMNVMVVKRADLAQHTTAAHEFGHLLGLGERQTAHRGPLPSIMYQRGTAAFIENRHRHDPTNKYSGLNPIFRRPLQDDVSDLERMITAPPGKSSVYIGDVYATRWKIREARQYLRKSWR